jgi:predicted Co/Zn/Cd cation transporter (cation efflux family)
VLAIRAGGSDADVGAALVYSVLTLLLSVGVAAVLGRAGTSSELVAADATQWRASAVLSAALTVGFALAVALERSGAGTAARFVDPALVLLCVAMLLPTPLRMVRSTFASCSRRDPGRRSPDPSSPRVEDVRRDVGLPEPQLRIGKLGRKLYVELDFVVEPGRVGGR